MLIVKLRNAVKICDKMTFCTARFSWIKVRHLTDSRFKRIGGFRWMTFLAKSRNSGGTVFSKISIINKILIGRIVPHRKVVQSNKGRSLVS